MRAFRILVFSIITATFSVVVALAGAEIGLRMFYLNDSWSTRNFVADPVNPQHSNIAIAYDPVIGYVAREGYRDGTNSHGRHGVRVRKMLKAGDPLPPIPTGGILASGDSFTFGSEVKDHQTWPVRLEDILGVSVVNTGAGGYGIDQAALRAVQMLDVVKPRAIIIGFIPNNVGRNEYSINQGLIKSYFDIENDKLVLKGVPVPDYRPSRKHVGFFRATLGHSYGAFWVADRLGHRAKWLVHEGEVRVAHRKGVEVSCRLWGWFRDKIKRPDIRLIALVQYAGIHINGHDKVREHFKIEKIMDCARKAGFLAVDNYDELRRRYEADEKSFWRNWVRQPHDKGRIWNTGHMSVKGNRLTAQLLAKAIRENYPELLGK